MVMDGFNTVSDSFFAFKCEVNISNPIFNNLILIVVTLQAEVIRRVSKIYQ